MKCYTGYGAYILATVSGGSDGDYRGLAGRNDQHAWMLPPAPSLEEEGILIQTSSLQHNIIHHDCHRAHQTGTGRGNSHRRA